MERGSSINIQDMKLEAYEHNHRTYTPSYAIDTSDKNEYLNLVNDKLFIEKNNKLGKYEKIDFQKIQSIFEDRHKETTKRTAQKSIKWFKEAVVNTNSTTTMEQLKMLSKVLQNEFNVMPLDIAHHKDEGYIDDLGNKNINYHCHIIFVNADKNGITKKWDKAELRKLQTRVAEILEMPRGIDKRISGNRRLEHKEYKKYINEVNELKKQNLELSKELKATQKVLSMTKQENKELATYKDRFNNASDTIKQMQNEKNELLELFNALGLNEIKQKTQDNIKKIKQMLLEKLALEYNQERDKLKQSQQATQKQYQELKKDNDNKKELINEAFKKQLTNNVNNKNSYDIDR